MKAYKILQSMLVSAALAAPFSAAAESYEFGEGISGVDAALYSQMGVVDSGARYEYLNGRAQEGSSLVQTASRENATKGKQAGKKKQVAKKKMSVAERRMAELGRKSRLEEEHRKATGEKFDWEKEI